MKKKVIFVWFLARATKTTRKNKKLTLLDLGFELPINDTSLEIFVPQLWWQGRFRGLSCWNDHFHNNRQGPYTVFVVKGCEQLTDEPWDFIIRFHPRSVSWGGGILFPSKPCIKTHTDCACLRSHGREGKHERPSDCSELTEESLWDYCMYT